MRKHLLVLLFSFLSISNLKSVDEALKNSLRTIITFEKNQNEFNSIIKELNEFTKNQLEYVQVEIAKINETKKKLNYVQLLELLAFIKVNAKSNLRASLTYHD
jgi:hypothetical protein